MDFDPLQGSGKSGGRGLDDAERAVLESERGHGDIFHFNAFMSQRGEPSGQVLDGSHQPAQQIDAVNGLVHQRSAAVEFPGAAPGTAVVILLRAIPLHVGIADRQSTETALIDRLS